MFLPLISTLSHSVSLSLLLYLYTYLIHSIPLYQSLYYSIYLSFSLAISPLRCPSLFHDICIERERERSQRSSPISISNFILLCSTLFFPISLDRFLYIYIYIYIS